VINLYRGGGRAAYASVAFAHRVLILREPRRIESAQFTQPDDRRLMTSRIGICH
jgi:hypothetical protein